MLPGEISDLKLSCQGYSTARGYVSVIINGCQGPSRLLRSGGEAAKEAGNPETHAAFIGERILWSRDKRRECECTPDQNRLNRARQRSRLPKR